MPTAIIMVLKVNKKKLFNFDFIIPSFVCIVNLPCRNVNEFMLYWKKNNVSKEMEK
ncbi:hypothetical protein CLOSCI_04010 [[Clostridium] scindens ATCC 35704]|nr:hypothetical protein CLOSCI_04010 [[Clostridium] scindens ATCC 35704]